VFVAGEKRACAGWDLLVVGKRVYFLCFLMKASPDTSSETASPVRVADSGRRGPCSGFMARALLEYRLVKICRYDWLMSFAYAKSRV
jgi:hypothetical protein